MSVDASMRWPAVRGAMGLFGFGLLLEVLPRVGVLPRAYFPPSSVIVGAFVEELGRSAFWQALAGTLETWLIGLGIAIVAGVTFGIGIGSAPWLRAVTASTIEFLRPIPSVALLPLAVVLFAAPVRSILMLVVYASFWQVIIQVLHGVADVDPVARDTAASYRLGRYTRTVYLIWPTTAPYAMTGIRLAASVALVLTITGELLIGGTAGIGEQLAVAQTGNAIPRMYALVVVSGLLGLAANAVTRLVERLILAWHPSVRKEVPA